MKRALLSVSDKSGIVEFAESLVKLGFELISTGGTYRKLKEAGVGNLRTIEDFTGFPEGLEGRIKTLTPQVFGGVLADRSKPAHLAFCEENTLPMVDLVVVNLYPFKAAYEDQSKDFAAKVEQIDIGGPSMIRAAAKNYRFCAPVVDPADYDAIVRAYEESGDLPQALRVELATKTFEMTAHYDLLIAKMWRETSTPLRYGENPHQTGAMLANPFATGASLASAEVLNGKPLSFNNYADASAALELALHYDVQTPFATVFKHMTPCGAAVGETLSEAFAHAHAGDPTSAFGGVIAVNQTLDAPTAEKIIGFFNEIVIAPNYTPEALEILRTKKNLRVLKIADWAHTHAYQVKSVRGGTLMQDLDTKIITEADLVVATDTVPTPEQMKDLLAAWPMVKIVKSNGIVCVKNGMMLGKGGGQTSRVDAMGQALAHAGKRAQGAVIASDAFFPFADNIELAAKAGITAIIQPGGSKKDPEVIEAANKAGIAMVFTGTRGFLH